LALGKGAHPEDQFWRVERLHEVVVAEAEPVRPLAGRLAFRKVVVGADAEALDSVLH